MTTHFSFGSENEVKDIFFEDLKPGDWFQWAQGGDDKICFKVGDQNYFVWKITSYDNDVDGFNWACQGEFFVAERSLVNNKACVEGKRFKSQVYKYQKSQVSLDEKITTIPIKR